MSQRGAKAMLYRSIFPAASDFPFAAKYNQHGQRRPPELSTARDGQERQCSGQQYRPCMRSFLRLPKVGRIPLKNVASSWATCPRVSLIHSSARMFKIGKWLPRLHQIELSRDFSEDGVSWPRTLRPNRRGLAVRLPRPAAPPTSNHFAASDPSPQNSSSREPWDGRWDGLEAKTADLSCHHCLKRSRLCPTPPDLSHLNQVPSSRDASYAIDLEGASK